MENRHTVDARSTEDGEPPLVIGHDGLAAWFGQHGRAGERSVLKAVEHRATNRVGFGKSGAGSVGARRSMSRASVGGDARHGEQAGE